MTGPRTGSRPWSLLSLKVCESAFFEVPAGKPVTKHMQQIQTDISRNGLTGKMQQVWYLAAQPFDKTVMDIIKVTRIKE